MDTTIRPYAPRDREAVTALALHAWEPGYLAMARNLGERLFERVVGDWREAHRRDVQADLDADEVGVWVAVTDTVAGFVTVKLDRAEHIGEIHMIAVDPDQQNRGVGSALTAFAVEHMREEGMSIAHVNTGGDPGHAPARATYEKAGFTALPAVNYFKHI